MLYLTGLGAVTPAIAAGQPGGGGTYGGELSWADGNVSVTVNGQTALLYYDGLAPDFAGLYQINFQMPETTMAGPGGNHSQLWERPAIPAAGDIWNVRWLIHPSGDRDPSARPEALFQRAVSLSKYRRALLIAPRR